MLSSRGQGRIRLLFLAVAAGGMGSLAFFLVDQGLDRADKWMSVISGFVGLIGIAGVLWPRRRSTDLDLRKVALLTQKGQLPLVKTVDPLNLGVKPAIGMVGDRPVRLPQYVVRDCHENLDWAIASGGLVLLHG